VLHLRVYAPREAPIRKYLEFTTNVVKKIKINEVPETSMEIVKNCAAPANTRRDISVRLTRERPAFLAKSPQAIAKEATPKNSGAIAFSPSRNSVGSLDFFKVSRFLTLR